MTKYILSKSSVISKLIKREDIQQLNGHIAAENAAQSVRHASKASLRCSPLRESNIRCLVRLKGNVFATGATSDFYSPF